MCNTHIFSLIKVYESKILINKLQQLQLINFEIKKLFCKQNGKTKTKS